MKVIGGEITYPGDITGSTGIKLHLRNGKLAVVTGGTSGIGFYVSLGLVSKNVHVVIGGRNIQEGKEAIEKIRQEYPNAKVDFLHLNLASLKSVQDFVENIKARCSNVHILVNNAGVMFASYEETADSLESHFQVNYLGHLYLTQSLMEILKISGTDEFYSRIINVSSIVHNIGSLNLQNFEGRCLPWWEYSPHAAYANSKLYITLASWCLSKQLKHENGRVTVNALHPGIVDTPLYRHVHWSIKWFLNCLASYTYLTPLEGADTVLYMALSSNVERETGVYYDNCKQQKTCQLSYSDDVIKKMYNISTDIISSRVECKKSFKK
ncbi:dehydrogenase/reductase SDR family member on chromosome X-like isoform X3 [Ostrea edulis]|uniref:dehydrogenase/reductase SDR family member on chromosome X-like isoform X3 n=1 Tax=Ostrea edulis TaxID=37623 RepID=UPI0024AF9C4A|nr:dehydrogenase/reductase SDR family member on chromosome X-like isoform X3 [Ostrea edulis]